MSSSQLFQWLRPARLGWCLLSIIVGLSAALALLLLGDPPPRVAWAADIIVNPGESIQAAINGATNGDTIIVNPGVYTESLTLSKAVSLTGAAAETTIIHAMSGQRVLTVTGAAINNTVVISGLMFTGGAVTSTFACPEGCGGGLLITGTAQPLLQNMVISGNLASDGGGLYAHTGSNLTLVNVSTISNTADGRQGGGLYVASAVTLTDGLLRGNSSFLEGGGLYVGTGLNLTSVSVVGNMAGDDGGGAYVGGTAALTEGLFQDNYSAGLGGGLYAVSTATLTNMQFLSNTAYGSGFYFGHGGGGLYAVGAVELIGGLFQGNLTTFGDGGGVEAGALTLTGTQFVGNITSGYGDGGGACAHGVATITGGLFQGNTGWTGGGLYAGSGLTMTDTQFLSNTAGFGGGIGQGSVADRLLTLNGGLFQGNVAFDFGGGLYVQNFYPTLLTLTATQFLSNTASHGGGVYLARVGTTQIVNALFARNSASSTFGQGLYLGGSGSTTILHTTIAPIGAGADGSAVFVTTGTVGITNTILVSHSVGISRTGGVVFEDYNLFFGNGVDTAGSVTSGGHSLTGDPAFVNPTGDDYHLRRSSAAMDAGVDAGVTEDFDGDLRPQGAGFDIGFDEFVNVAPIGVTDAYPVRENTPRTISAPGVLANDADPNADVLTATLINAPASGVLDLNPDGGFTYTPTLNFLGVVTFTYQASDGLLDSNLATVTLNVSPNEAPVAVVDAYTTSEDVSLTVSAPGVLANDTDANGDVLTATLVSAPASGALTLNPDGGFTYTPTLNFNGTMTFTYRASDSLLDSNAALVTLTVSAENDAPTLSNLADVTTTVGLPVGPITFTVGDADTGDVLTVVGNSSDQSLVPDANIVFGGSGPTRTVTITPTARLAGTAVITVTASDGHGGITQDTFVLAVVQDVFWRFLPVISR